MQKHHLAYLKDWLFPESAEYPSADVYVIGMQEIVDLNMMNVVVNNKNSDENASYWVARVSEALGHAGSTYALAAERHMVGITLMIFVRKSLVSHISSQK